MSKATPIPPAARAEVKGREMGRCLRCGAPAPNGHWHHRRSRSRRDQHTHCPCNGVWLCGTCHEWVHQHPFEAKALGFIVSKYVDDPGVVPVRTWFGNILNTCEGERLDAVDS